MRRYLVPGFWSHFWGVLLLYSRTLHNDIVTMHCLLFLCTEAVCLVLSSLFCFGFYFFPLFHKQGKWSNGRKKSRSRKCEWSKNQFLHKCELRVPVGSTCMRELGLELIGSKWNLLGSCISTTTCMHPSFSSLPSSCPSASKLPFRDPIDGSARLEVWV